MATAQDALNLATKDIGTVEAPPGSNKTAFAGIAEHLNGYAWCATWVVAVMRRAGIKLPSESAWTTAMFNGLQQSASGVVDLRGGLRLGDIVFFDFVSPFNTRGIQHVGIFVKYLESGYIETIEGNTSSGEGGSQDNGDGVYRRKRPLKYIVGAGRPAYTAATPIPVVAFLVPPTEEDPVAVTIARPQGGYINVGKDGGVFTYRDAPFFGSMHGAVSPSNAVVGGAWTPSGAGYWLLARDGAVYSFGDAAYRGGFNAMPPEVRGTRYAVGIVAVGNGYAITTFDPSNDGSPFDEYAFGV